MIKNSSSRTTIAIKSLQADHRLLLSGTPIQNNVLELWSLFDFLMPGYLGTEVKEILKFICYNYSFILFYFTYLYVLFCFTYLYVLFIYMFY